MAKEGSKEAECADREEIGLFDRNELNRLTGTRMVLRYGVAQARTRPVFRLAARYTVTTHGRQVVSGAVIDSEATLEGQLRGLGQTAPEATSGPSLVPGTSTEHLGFGEPVRSKLSGRWIQRQVESIDRGRATRTGSVGMGKKKSLQRIRIRP